MRFGVFVIYHRSGIVATPKCRAVVLSRNLADARMERWAVRFRGCLRGWGRGDIRVVVFASSL